MSEKTQQQPSSFVLKPPEKTEDKKQNQRQDYTHAEIVEAKTAVILLDSTTIFTKNEYIHWRLSSMFKPLAIGHKTECMEVLYLSHQRKHNWLSEYKNDDSNSVMMSAPSAPLSSTLFRHPLNDSSSSSSSRQQKKEYIYVITPRTNVITFTKICRLVFMVDLSSSLATVGNTKSQLLLYEVFKTLRNSLEGIVHPFCLQISSNERIMIRPVLLLTVVADCSQFASNVNVIPMLVNHPSMRVFIQNVRITLDNIDHVVSDLYEAFILFQKDITIHRKQLKRKRSSMGYDLEVDEGPVPSYERSVFDATSLPSSMDLEHYNKDNNNNGGGGGGTTSRKLKRKPRSMKSSPSAWGMGKTGANLTRMLYAGAFALSLLPQQGRSQLILVTDGALKSHLHDNSVARQFAEQDVACHVIQIGFNQSFIPGRNFGFIPDVDTLKFLAQATGGTFLYSDECLRLDRPGHDPDMDSSDNDSHHHHHRHHHRHHRFIQSSIMKKQKGSTMDDEISEDGGSKKKKKSQASMSSPLENDWWWNLDPNIYHRHFVLRESNLEKIRTLTPFLTRHYFNPRPIPTDQHVSSSQPHTENDTQHQHHHHLRLQQGSSGIMAMTNFPWDPEGTTPPIEWRLLRYREYALPDDFAPMIAARAREGFYLQSVLFDTKSVNSKPSSTPSSSSSDILQSKQNSNNINSKKKKRKPSSSNIGNASEECIQITMVLYWKPHVIIEYRIRATWHQQITWGTLFSRTTSPHVEVFIRCDAEFAHMLQNWTSLRRRAQMMMMMGGGARERTKNGGEPLFFKGEPQAAQAYANIEKLKTYMQCLFEGDDLLKEWLDPKNEYFSPIQDYNHLTPNLQLLNDRFHSFWFSRFFTTTEENRILTRCWYDLDCIDILVGDISPYMDPKLTSVMNQEFGPHVQQTIQSSIMSVIKLLKKSWADFELTGKKNNNDGDDEQPELDPWFVKFIPTSKTEDSTHSTSSPTTSTTSWSTSSLSSSTMTHSGDLEKSGVLEKMDWSEFKTHPRFCQLKVKHDYGRLITLRFLFFNVHASIRQDIKVQVMDLLQTKPPTLPFRNELTICTRPLSRLLIRDDNHFKQCNVLFPTSSISASETEEEDGSKKKSGQKTKQSSSYRHQQQQQPYHQQKSAAWYLPVGLWVTGEHIVHDYLLHSIWSWQTDNYQDAYHRENKMMPVHDLAFQLLCQARVDQGYHLVLPQPDNTHFYQEIAFPRDTIYMKRNTHQRPRKSDHLCAIQYFIRKDNTKGQGRIITELWVEPSVHHINHRHGDDEEEDDNTRKMTCKSDYDWIKTWIEVPDRKIISHLVTFDQVHAIGRTKGKGDFKPQSSTTLKKSHDADDDDDTMVKMLLPHLFDISFVLKTNNFVIASYILPSRPPPPTTTTKMKKSTLEFIFSNSDMSTLSLLDKLPCQYQAYCMLHYYFEQALERNVMDGQVVMTQHNARREFWSALKNAIHQVCHHDMASSNLAHLSSFKKMKCYVNIIDARSFLIILVPELKHLLSVFLDTKAIYIPSRFDCLLFECVRQKPLRANKEPPPPPPSKYKHHWLPSLLDDQDQNDEEYGNVTLAIQHIDPAQPKLVTFSDFLPEPVYCGHFHRNGSTMLSEQSQKFVYKVTEAYSHAFIRAIYTVLLTHILEEGCSVPLPLCDLVKALTICHTTVINIDITRFVSIMACPSISLRDDMDEKWKMTLDPYFKPIMTSQMQNDDQIVTETADLLLYIPPLCDATNSCKEFQTPPGAHPLFVGFNITLGQTDDHMTTLCEEPISFDQLKRTMIAFSEEKYDNEDTFFAKTFPDMESVEPITSTTTPRLTLNLICKSIVIDEDINNKRRGSSMSSTSSSSSLSSEKKNPVTYLTSEQTMILSKTVTQIEWSFTEQVLDGLLVLQKKQEKTNKQMLHYIVEQLDKKDSQDQQQQQTKFNVPFHFVSKDLDLCTRLFMDFFEKNDKDQDDRISRLDPYFHIIWSPLTLLVASGDDIADGGGLGISVDEQQKVPDAYWLIVVVHLCYAEIYYFPLSDQVNPSTLVIDHTIRHIRKIEKQTNQKILLDMLQENRICSKYLEAPPSDIKSIDSDSSQGSQSSEETNPSSSDEAGLGEEAFTVGQFQCPLVYHKEFPLHWRVPLGKALHYLKNDVLRPFTVINRKDMYVIEREKTIVYCKLNEKPSSSMTPLFKDEADGQPMASNELEMLVYGLECPDWIAHGVVTLIENRLMSEVTLEELQTFFTRNPTSKPTISDVRFILPFDKKSPETEILRIPNLVSNSSLLLGFFKRFLLAEDFKAFKGPNVVTAISGASSYHFDQVYQGNDDQSDGIDIPKDDLCIYYNCIKRIPGVSSAFELACGQGMAGICMTLRNQQGKCMTTLPPKNGNTPGFNFDPDAIRQSLETELRVTTIQDNDHPLCIWIDVWTIGSVDANVLLQRIHDDYRRALCDYLIEETVTIDMASVLLYESTALQQAVSHDRARGFRPTTSAAASHRQLSTLLRKKFIQSIVYMLQKSVTWKNPTVHAMETDQEEPKWEMSPWCMKDIISHLHLALVELDPSLEPTITWKKIGNQYDDTKYDDHDSSEWLLYRGGSVFCRNNIQNNIRTVAISGLNEFVEQFGGAAGSSPAIHFSPIQKSSSIQRSLRYPYQKRRTSLKSDPSRRSSASTEVNIDSTDQNRRVSSRSRGSSTSFAHYPSVATGDDTSIHPLSHQQPSSGLVPRADRAKHCFLIMIMDVDRLVLYAYNWTEQQSARLFNTIFSTAHQQRMRSHVLNAILHQKMGLFHHNASLETIAQHYFSLSSHEIPPPPQQQQHPVATTTTEEGSTSKNRPNLKKTKSELKVNTQTTTTPSTSAPATPRYWTASDLLISQVIGMDLPPLLMTNAVTSTPGSNVTKKMSTSPSTPQKQKRQQRALSYSGNKLDPLSMANPDLNHVLMDAIADPVSYNMHDDLLRRHGNPYLATYLQQATLVSVHRKALQVYLKWRKRFGGSMGNTPLASPLLKYDDGEEKLTRYEVAEILRSSRLLHFCRAPFFFFTAADHQESSDHLLDWYRHYLRTFVVNYSRYLEKLNLQVVEFANSSDILLQQQQLLPSPILNADGSLPEEDDTIDDHSTAAHTISELNISKFETGIEGVTVEHPSTYLLKVSDAGSIICEIRFTHMFVSVSLYGLHRQHGLFNFHNPSMTRQQFSEIKRIHFKTFEQGVGQLKHLIHIHSFVYDFHLYYIQHLLLQPPPPSGVNVLRALDRFHSFYTTPSHYSTNRLFSGVYECKQNQQHHHHPIDQQQANVDLQHFFKYLYNDHASYGLEAVTQGENIIGGVYLSSTCITFNNTRHGDDNDDEDSIWKYTLILCPMTENTLTATLDQNPKEVPRSVTASSVLIRYFILAVYQPDRTPSSLVKNFWATSSSHSNIIVHARKKIDCIVSKVIKSCKQRFSWYALLPNTLKTVGGNEETMDGTHWYPLVLKFQSFSLLHGKDTNLTRLILMVEKNTLPWHNMIDLFLRIHQPQCRHFLYKEHRHVLFYHPIQNMDALIDIMENQDDQETTSIDIRLVRRDPHTNQLDSLTPIEQELVASLGQSLCYILWKYTKNEL